MSGSLTYKNGLWLKSCGCGGKYKPEDVVDVPENSTMIMPLHNGKYTGKSGIKYHFRPGLAAIDVDIADAQSMIAEHKATEYRPGTKGYISRVS